MPDEKKGERLVVLHTLPEDKLAPVLQSFATCELPALGKPRANQFIRVVALPMLGTGKIDLRGVKEQAAKLVKPARLPRGSIGSAQYAR